ncbi:DUF3592 domain-containing protein [Bounagaea algeriensis]
MASETREVTTGERSRRAAEVRRESGGSAPGEREEVATSREREDSGADAEPGSAEPGVSEAGESEPGRSDAGLSGGSADRTASGAAGAQPSGRTRRIVARTALVLGLLATLMAGTLLGACAINDHTISEARGTAAAEVVDTSPVRAAVRFTNEDGRIYIPDAGALYPSGLKPGQTVLVEYDMRNPDLVRVAGRDVTVALLPVGSALAATWIVLLPVYWVARRR